MAAHLVQLFFTRYFAIETVAAFASTTWAGARNVLLYGFERCKWWRFLALHRTLLATD